MKLLKAVLFGLFCGLFCWQAGEDCLGATVEQIADAIYLAEGGAKTAHPYGIMAHYQHTSPRQACINTILHAQKDWDGKGDFIEYLAKRYAPVGCKNDNGTNKFWAQNVKYFMGKKK